MTIIEALKISDKVRREAWKGWQGTGGWISFKGDEIVYPVYFTKEDLLATDWQPYEPEKVKVECEACKEADFLNNKGSVIDTFIHSYIVHLRKHHCQCKGGK